MATFKPTSNSKSIQKVDNGSSSKHRPNQMTFHH